MLSMATELVKAFCQWGMTAMTSRSRELLTPSHQTVEEAALTKEKKLIQAGMVELDCSFLFASHGRAREPDSLYCPKE